MHFAYKVSATEFGQRKGCLFYDLGCRGPMTHSPCNRILWNRQSSKTRAGMPCLGCTEPEFPFFDLAPGTVFKTQTRDGRAEGPADRHRQDRLHQADRGGQGGVAALGRRRHLRGLTHDEPSHGTVQTLDISPVGRVEGDLDVRVDIEDGVVVNAWTQAELFRGFEVILRDKDPQAGLVVTPRACGICGASHLTCAAWALDTAWETEVPRNAILARNLGQIVESLQSLPRHHYGLFMIDYTNKKYAQLAVSTTRRCGAGRPSPARNYEIGVTISGQPVEIYALFGGQWPHSSYMVPGGVMCAPTLTDVTRAWSILEYFRRNWIEPVWLGCSLERYEEIRTYDDFMAWLDEKPEHANSDLGLYWRMSLDIGLDTYGGGLGALPQLGLPAARGQVQEADDRWRATPRVIMKSGVYDGTADTHTPDRPGRDPRGHDARLVRRAGRSCTRSTATTAPSDQNDARFRRPLFLGDGGSARRARAARGRPARAPAGVRRRRTAKPGSTSDPLVLDMYKQAGRRQRACCASSRACTNWSSSTARPSGACASSA